MTSKNKTQNFDITGEQAVAGSTVAFPTGEALFLSPLPVPTGQLPFDLDGSIVEINETYLDLGSTNSGKIFQAQIMITNIMLVILFFFAFTPFIAGATAWGNPHGVTFWSRADAVLDYTYNLALWLIAMTTLIALYVIFGSTIKKTKTRPIRFNRQKREICYFPENSDTPIIRPWEETIAWISISFNTTGVGLIKTYTLGIAIEDKANGLTHYINNTVPSPYHGIGQWEAIRTYMEKGPDYCPEKSTPEGLHTFDVKRKELHSEQKGMIAKSWWLLTHLISWWKIPYLIAEWDHQHSMKAMPETINEWSKPIPKLQWAHPSPELSDQTSKIEKAFSQGQDFMSYFKSTLKA
jgi:hypothetical protein